MPLSGMAAPLFHPTFGSRPAQIIGRDGEMQEFLAGLEDPIGSRDRCTLFLGQRGMGKTALLLELAERAAKNGFVVARVTAHEKMADAIIEQVQLNGSQYIHEDKHRVKGVSAGALGFSFGLTFSEATQRQYGFRTKMSLLCDRLAEQGRGVLILIDEAQTSPAMREVASSYQELVGDGKNVAIGMAGLPHAISGVLNDHVLTFLNRARRVQLGPISKESIRAYFAHAFRIIGIESSGALLDRAAEGARGLPYLMQLLGYYIVRYTQDTKLLDSDAFNQAENAALHDMEQNVFEPILTQLSNNDRLFLEAMSIDEGTTTIATLQKRFGDSGPAIQPYRKRLIDAGVIESPRRGERVFAVPYLAE